MKNKDYLIVGPFTKDLNTQALAKSRKTSFSSLPSPRIERGSVGEDERSSLTPQGFSVGGSAFYSGITAKKLGSKVKILSSFSRDLIKEKKLKQFDIFRIPSLTTTTFENVYHKGKRHQYLYQRTSVIRPKHLPKNWRNCSIVQLAPLAQEVDEKIVFSFPNSLIGANLQGWLRKRDKNKLVSFNFWKNYKKFLPEIDIAFLSEEDAKKDLGLVKELAKFANILVLTQGKRGCTVYHQNKAKHFKARKTKEIHLTGAGDVFAAAFLIKFQETRNPEKAARFANFIASFFIGKGSFEKLKI